MMLSLLLAATITLDLEQSPLKDQREHDNGTGVGYAGCLMEVSLYEGVWNRWAFGPGIKETEKALKDAGAYYMRMWGALDTWQLGMAGHFNYTNPMVYFKLWKKMGAKVLFTLEPYSVYSDKKCTKRKGDPETLKRVVGEFVGWIVKNRFQDVVAGFELGNEPYFGHNPEGFAANCREIVPVIKKIWPEAHIGLAVAEYRMGDPDLEQVRKRLADKNWIKGAGEFDLGAINQWSGRFVTALSNTVDQIDHVIYHFYGADAPYGASATGFYRVKNFAKLYPQLEGKRVWLTEVRERSDEDVRCHKMWFSTLWKAHYMLLALAQPEVDGVNVHCLGCYAGGLNLSQNGKFYFQSDPLQGYEFYLDPDGGQGMRRYHMGPAAPMYRLYNEALIRHPIILQHGVGEKQGQHAGEWASALYYASANAQRNVLNAGKGWHEVPPIKGAVEWIAALNPSKTELALLMVNTCADRQYLQFVITPKTFTGLGEARWASCPVELAYHHSIPGEEGLWTEGVKKLTGAFNGNQGMIEIEPNTVQTVVMGIR